MIVVTSLHEHTFVINADLIESIEETPDTMIRMTTGKKIVVKESVAEVVQKVVDFKRRCFFPMAGTPPPDAASPDSA
jgi:flagellar protein FlbD